MNGQKRLNPMPENANIHIFTCWANNLESLREILKGGTLYFTGLKKTCAAPGCCDVFLSNMPASDESFKTSRVKMMSVVDETPDEDFEDERSWKRWSASGEVAAMASMLTVLGYEVLFGFEFEIDDWVNSRIVSRLEYRSYSEALTDMVYPCGREKPMQQSVGSAFRDEPQRVFTSSPVLMKSFDPSNLK